MNIRVTLLYIIAILILACGSKPKISEVDTFINSTADYVVKIESNSKFIEEFTEGALTDKEGFKDIGTFKYAVLFDKETKELFRIKNTETTDKVVTERYYFHNHGLVYIEVSNSGQPVKKIYTQKDAKIIVSKSNVSDEESKLLIDKGQRFQKAFQRRE